MKEIRIMIRVTHFSSDHSLLRPFAGVFLSNDRIYAYTLFGSKLSDIKPSVDLPSSL